MIAPNLYRGLREPCPLQLAMLAADDLCQYLHDYARTTDEPSFEAVRATDLLDAVTELLECAVTGVSRTCGP